MLKYAKKMNKYSIMLLSNTNNLHSFVKHNIYACKKEKAL